MIKLSKFTFFMFVAFFLAACSNHSEALKTLPSEQQIADQCKNTNINFEMDCYDLISYKNSFAMLRLGIFAQNRGLVEEAFKRYTEAKNKGNFYANTLLSNLYGNGLGVDFDEKKSINLLKDAQSVDPMAAYKLSFFYFSNNETKKAIELLEYAANSGLKDAQKELVLIYSNEQYIEEDLEKSLYFDSLYQDGEEDFMKTIYGR